MKLKINKKMIPNLVAIAIAGIFLVIAFLALEFRFKLTVTTYRSADGSFLKNPIDENTKAILSLDKLKTMKDASDAPEFIETIYGCAIASLVLMLTAIIFPLVSLFYKEKKTNMILGILTWTFVGVAFILGISSVSTYSSRFSQGFKNVLDNEFKLLYPKADIKAYIDTNLGYIIGQDIFVILGAAAAMGTTNYAYKEFIFKSKNLKISNTNKKD